MDIKQTLTSAVVAIVLILGAFMFVHPSDGAPGTPGTKGADGQTYGSLAGPDIPFPYLNWGGVNTTQASMTMNQGTTTPCAIQAPAATSTLRLASAAFAVSSSSATRITFAKAVTNPTATTTLISVGLLAAGVQGTVIASTTLGAAVDDATTFAPNTWLVVGVAGGDTGVNATGFVPVGVCKASWTVLSV